MRWFIIAFSLTLTLGCESASEMVLQEPRVIKIERKPIITPIDLDYEPVYAEPGQYLFISRASIDIVDYKHDIRRGIIQLATNRKVLDHRASVEVRGAEPTELFLIVGEYKTQTHLSLSFSRASLPKTCYIHVTIVYAEQTDSVVFKLDKNTLIHRGYIVSSKRAP